MAGGSEARFRGFFCAVAGFALLRLDLRARAEVPPALSADAAPAETASIKSAGGAPEVRLTEWVAKGELALALQETEAALRRRPDDLGLLLLKGRIHRLLRQHWAALEVYRAVRTQAPREDTLDALECLLYVQLARETSDRRAAVAWMERGAGFSHLEGSGWVRAEYLRRLLEGGRVEDALHVLKTFPPDSEERTPSFLTAVAHTIRLMNRPAQAAGLYEEALQRAPGHPDAAAGLALICLATGEVSRAEALLEEAITLHPEHPGLLYALASVEEQMGAWARAAHTYGRLLTRTPIDPDAIQGRLRALVAAGCLGLACEWADTHRRVIDPSLVETAQRAQRVTHRLWDTVASAIESRSPPLLALVYEDVRTEATEEGLSIRTLISHLEYLRARGYRFISGQEVRMARQGAALPDRAALLVFEGGYASFLDLVLPALTLYECPAVIGICPDWIDDPAPNRRHPPPMSWTDVKRVAGRPGVELALYPQKLGRLVPRNPQGDLAPAGATRICTPAQGYESSEAFRQRLTQELRAERGRIEQQTGRAPITILWPERTLTGIGLEVAAGLGFTLSLSEESMRQPSQMPGEPGLSGLRICRVPRGQAIEPFIRLLHTIGEPPEPTPPLRAVAVRMDRVIGGSSVQPDPRIHRLLARLRDLGVSTVWVDGLADSDLDGTPDSALFPNRVLPVHADVLSHLVERLKAEGCQVFVRMPLLGVMLPDRSLNGRLAVMSRWNEEVLVSRLWVHRLSPFHSEALALLEMLYEDLAGHVDVDGIVLGEDGFLTDREDFNPAAMERLRDEVGGAPEIPLRAWSESQRKAWIEVKTRRLTELAVRLAGAVRRYRPQAMAVRSLFAPALHFPASQAWLAQDYGQSLQAFDRVAIVADPETEGVAGKTGWLRSLVQAAARTSGGLGRTIFVVPMENPMARRLLPESEVARRVKLLVEEGAQHIVCVLDRPLDYRLQGERLRSVLDAGEARGETNRAWVGCGDPRAESRRGAQASP